MKKFCDVIWFKLLQFFKFFRTFISRNFRKVREYFSSNPKKKVFFLIIFFILFLFLGGSAGRYVYLEVRDFYLASKNFYFNSDKLDVNLSRYQVDNWSGADTYTVTFNMNSYKNNDVYATSDIPYTIDFSCSSNVTCQSSKNRGVVSSSSHTDSFSITITPAVDFSDGDSVWLEVSTSSTAPYEKTLSGRFVIKVGKIGLSYEIVDKPGQPYFDLSVTNTLDYYLVKESFDNYEVGHRIDVSTYLLLSDADKAKCVSAKVYLDFNPNVAVLDMTNQNYLNALHSSTISINGYNYINSFDFKIEALSSSVVRFYKKNTMLDYTYPYVNDHSIVNVVFE